MIIICKIENAAVLQEITDDGADTDILADTRDTHLQAADTSNDQFDLHTCRTCFIQSTDNILIAERVHFRNDMGILALQRIIFLARSIRCRNLSFSHNGANASLFQNSGSGITGQHVKHCRGILADALRAGQHTHIRVQLRRSIVIVTGTQMDISADAILFSADHQCDLGMSL